MSDTNFDNSSHYRNGNTNGNGGYYSNGSRPGQNGRDGNDDKVDLKHLFAILMQRKWGIIGITATLTVAAVIYALSLTPIYESQGTMLITESQTRSNEMGGQLSGLLSATYGLGAGSTIGNELQILRSRRMSGRLAERVIEEERMENGSLFPVLWTSYPEDSTIAGEGTVASRIRQNINYATIGQNSEVVSITFKSPSPYEAQWMVDQAINAYTDLSTNQNRMAASSALEFLQQERQQIEQTLREKEEQLKQFMNRSGIVTMDQQTNQVISRISQLESHRQEVRTSLVAINTATNQYENQIEEIRPGLAEKFAEGLGSSMDRLQFQLAELETERMLFLSRNPELRQNPESEPQLVQIEEKIQLLRDEINQLATRLLNESDQFLSFIGSGDGGIPSRLLDLKSKMLELQVEKSQLEAQQQVLDERLALENQFFDNLPQNMVDLARLKRDVEINEELYLTISNQYAETAFWEQTQFGLGRPVDFGYFPGAPVEPKVWMIGLIGFLVGGFISIGYAFGRESFVKVIDGTDKLNKLNYPILSVIPDIQKTIDEKFQGRETISVGDSQMVSSSLLTMTNSISPVAESFRRLHNNIIYSQPDKSFQTIMVTSSVQAEGKTTLVSNLAVALSESGKKVLIIDLDLRRPNLHNVWKVSHRPGLIEVLFEDVTVEEAIQSSVASGVDLLTAGQETPNPSAINQSDSLRHLINGLKEKYDHILIDTAPYGIITDAAPAMRLADGIVILAKFNETKENQLTHTIENLERIHAKILGTVLTGFDYGKSSDYYYGIDDYYYAYKAYDSYHNKERA